MDAANSITDTLLQLGVGGAIAIIIVGMVLQFLKTKASPAAAHGKGGDTHPSLNGSTGRVITELQTIRAVLDARDSDGTPLVYTPRSLAGAISDLAEAVQDQNKLLLRLNMSLEELRSDVKDLRASN